jgi:hypothetical protein
MWVPKQALDEFVELWRDAPKHEPNNRKINQAGLSLIKDFEGCIFTPVMKV